MNSALALSPRRRAKIGKNIIPELTNPIKANSTADSRESLITSRVGPFVKYIYQSKPRGDAPNLWGTVKLTKDSF